MDMLVQHYLNIGSYYQLNIDKLIYIRISCNLSVLLLYPNFHLKFHHKMITYLFMCVQDDDGKSKLDLFMNTHATIVIGVILL
jgi:hypothetical protein